MIRKICNIAIIAHVDHGKTTLIDKLLQQSGFLSKKDNFVDRIMDSNDLEKERGITIFSKHASFKWKDYNIHIVDTPGHSDFGGEVERIMSMVDSVLLLVDAYDGPMPQTRFVTQKAFLHSLKPIVLINKIDKDNIRPNWVIDQIFELFINLGADDNQLDFPIIYTSAINGIAGFDLKNMYNDMTPLFDLIINNVKPREFNVKNNLQIQISQLDYNNYLGHIGIGLIKSGSIKLNQSVSVVNEKGEYRICKVNKIFRYVGLKKVEIKKAIAGDIILLSGLGKLNISDTICDTFNIKPLPPLLVDDPTIAVHFSINTSPLCGKEGKYINFRQILNRLKKEIMSNVSLKIEEVSNKDTVIVYCRGELHISILIEHMRREGFELSVSKPKVITKFINGIEKEPFEYVTLNIKEEHKGLIIKYMNIRKCKMVDFSINNKRCRLDYIAPSKLLLGFRYEFLNITSGTGIYNSSFSHYDNIVFNDIYKRKKGVLISNSNGRASTYALYNIQNHGNLFINSGSEVYEGQIIGINSRINDLTVNCIIGKKLTNMRASGSDESNILNPIKRMSLEQCLEFIEYDELIEITPKSIRLRKLYLKENDRKKLNRKFKKKSSN